MDEETTDKQTGARVRAAREMTKMTQAEVAEGVWDLNVPLSPQMIGKIERGERSLSLMEADAIACVLRVDVQALSPGSTPESLLSKARLLLARMDERAEALRRAADEFFAAWEDADTASAAYKSESHRVRAEPPREGLLSLKKQEQETLKLVSTDMSSLANSLSEAVESSDEDMDDICEDLTDPADVEERDEAFSLGRSILADPLFRAERDEDYIVGAATPLSAEEARALAPGDVGECPPVGQEGRHFGSVLIGQFQWDNFWDRPQLFYDRIREHYDRYLARPEVRSAAERDWVGMRITMPNTHSTFLIATKLTPLDTGGELALTVLCEDLGARFDALDAARARMSPQDRSAPDIAHTRLVRAVSAAARDGLELCSDGSLRGDDEAKLAKHSQAVGKARADFAYALQGPRRLLREEKDNTPAAASETPRHWE